MSWDWAGLLAVGAVSASMFFWLAAAYRREVERLKVARAEVATVRRRIPPG
ncbi:MAG TPA: hypothetical protein VL984_06375 [Acidimicrobiales bacterium]|nr:hypothetical protein [Acidimicrobiales bacterium]